MAYPQWPVTLPQSPLRQGYSSKPITPVIRTQMSVGAPKSRLRATVALEARQMSYALTDAQRAVWKEFFKASLAQGALVFLWPDPEDALSLRRAKIADEAGYGLAPRGGTRWTLTLSLILLPG